MNDVTIPHAFALCTTSSVSERGDMDSENPEHRITLCKIYSIKTENIDGYIIKHNTTVKLWTNRNRLNALLIWQILHLK